MVYSGKINEWECMECRQRILVEENSPYSPRKDFKRFWFAEDADTGQHAWRCKCGKAMDDVCAGAWSYEKQKEFNRAYWGFSEPVYAHSNEPLWKKLIAWAAIAALVIYIWYGNR